MGTEDKTENKYENTVEELLNQAAEDLITTPR